MPKKSNQLKKPKSKPALPASQGNPERSRGAAPKFSTETSLRAEKGVQKIVGVDEVGRGALAGPLIVCAVELTREIPGVNDSKLINPPGRVILCGQIRALAEQIRFGWATNLEIDQLGLAAAQRLAYQRALNDIEAELVLTDNVALDRPHVSKIR
ncbi:MAG: hypothetical protein WEC83_01585, partial [Patescibacteria group bacterium]